MSDQDNLQLARKYIQEKNYDVAAAILKTMPDNPTAQAWLAKLKAMDVLASPKFIAQPAPKPSRKRFQLSQRDRYGAMFILGLLVVAFLVMTKNAPIPYALYDTLGVCAADRWYDNEASPLIDQYIIHTSIAISSPRVGVVSSLSEMKRIESEFDALDYPECAKEARDELSAGMYATNSAIADFAGGTDIALVSVQLESASEHFSMAHDFLFDIQVFPQSELTFDITSW